jgi:hypothetical protein
MAQCQHYESPDEQCPNTATTGDFCDNHQPPTPHNLKDLFHVAVGIAHIIIATDVIISAIEWTIHTVPHMLGTNKDVVEGKSIQYDAKTIHDVAGLCDPMDHETIDNLRTQLESVIHQAEAWKAQVKNRTAIPVPAGRS